MIVWLVTNVNIEINFLINYEWWFDLLNGHFITYLKSDVDCDGSDFFWDFCCQEIEYVQSFLYFGVIIIRLFSFSRSTVSTTQFSKGATSSCSRISPPLNTCAALLCSNVLVLVVSWGRWRPAATTDWSYIDIWGCDASSGKRLWEIFGLLRCDIAWENDELGRESFGMRIGYG